MYACVASAVCWSSTTSRPFCNGQPAGQYKTGYGDYEQFLNYVALYEHQSSLLITSRERPHHVATLEHSSGGVRSLLLAGLDEVAAQRILVEQGLTVTARPLQPWRRYSGNPLALSLVARSIEDLFLGDVDAYLVDDADIWRHPRRFWSSRSAG